MNSKKIINYSLIGLFVLVIIFVFVSFIPFKEKKYYVYEDKYILIPRLSILDDTTQEDNKYSVTFKSISSKLILTLNLDSSLDEYKRKLCNNDKYLYYNSDNDITISDYKIDKGFLFNKYTIYYYFGNISEYECMKILDIDKLEINYDYSYLTSVKHDIDYVDYKYLSDDGNKYDVHSDCPECFTIKSGVGIMRPFKELLLTSSVDMQMILDKLEEDVKNNKTVKTEYDNGTMYENDKINLFNCKNKDVYISDKIEYTDKLCKN